MLRLSRLFSIAVLFMLCAVPNALVPTAAAQQTSGQKIFLYCYSEPGGGLDFYYSDVFSFDVGGRYTTRGFMPDTLSMNKVLDAFSAYLKQKNYKFYHVNYEFNLDEAQAKAAKHHRAYEGNPCSNCGKVVETGWKYGDTQ